MSAQWGSGFEARVAEARRRLRQRSTRLRTLEQARRRRNRTVLVVLVAVGLAVPSVVLARDVLAVRDALVAAQAELEGVRTAIGFRDLERAAARTTAAGMGWWCFGVRTGGLSAPAASSVALSPCRSRCAAPGLSTI